MLLTLHLLPLLLLPPALASDFDALLTPAGWEHRGDGKHDLLGEVAISTKDVAGITCMLGTATVDAQAATMLAVVEDIEGALSWSTAGLIATRVLGQSGDATEYYQHLNVPGWTMSQDRYWVLQGQRVTEADGALSFRWDRFEWKGKYPELLAELERDHPKAIEPVPNYGAWSFLQGDAGTELRYYLCTASGSIPGWLQKAAATKTVPAAMADVVREAKKRGG